MAIPAVVKKTADMALNTYIERRVLPQLHARVRLVHRWRGNTVTLIEQRPWWRDEATWVDIPIAQFRYDNQRNDWTLYWQDRNQRWHLSEELTDSREITRLLAEVDRDPTGIFWG